MVLRHSIKRLPSHHYVWVEWVKKRIKMELTLAVAMAIAIATLAVYASLPRQGENSYSSLGEASTKSFDTARESQSSGASVVQRNVQEDIEGQLKKGAFEVIVESLRTLVVNFGGMVPYLNMAYDNELWAGTMDCNVPTENVTPFTFAVRQLISANGKVTHIATTVTETVVNQTQPSQEQFSQLNIGLREVSETAPAIMDQLGAAVPWLVIGLTWVAEGLIVGVPLCFVSLGVVMILDRGIIPAWRRQLKSRGTSKAIS
jgi:hypothetical protein